MSDGREVDQIEIGIADGEILADIKSSRGSVANRRRMDAHLGRLARVESTGE